MKRRINDLEAKVSSPSPDDSSKSPSAKSKDSPIRIVTTRSPDVGTYKGNEVALAAITTCTQEQERIFEFVIYILHALERNHSFVNNYISRQPNFKCVLMVGDGPNRFRVKDVIYPVDHEDDFTLDIELCGSEDHDKIAFAALLKLSHDQISQILDYAKNKLTENSTLGQDLVKGKLLGASFAVLRATSAKHYRLGERISIGEMAKALPTASKYSKRMERVKSPIVNCIKRLRLI